MLKRLLFRRHKAILAGLLWLCLVAVWIRSNASPNPKRSFHRSIHPNPHGMANHQHDLRVNRRDIVQDTMGLMDADDDVHEPLIHRRKIDETVDKTVYDFVDDVDPSGNQLKTQDGVDFKIVRDKNGVKRHLENHSGMRRSEDDIDYIKDKPNSNYPAVNNKTVERDRVGVKNSRNLLKNSRGHHHRHHNSKASNSTSGQNQSKKSGRHKTPSGHEGKNSARVSSRLRNLIVNGNSDESNKAGMKPRPYQPCIADGIYWTPEFIKILPEGIDESEADDWLGKIRNLQVKTLEQSVWNRCGRPKNGFAVMDDGSQVCARYRTPQTRLVQGEVLSYWLARYLGLSTVAPVALSLVNSGQWSKVSKNVKQMGWDTNQFVALIMWMDSVESSVYRSANVYMPEPLLEAMRLKRPVAVQIDTKMCKKKSRVNSHNLLPVVLVDKTSDVTENGTMGVTMETMIQIAQWGNLIIFDYLTANYDRVASMQDSADKENKPSILREPIRNLHKSKASPLLWFLDNESGLLDAYELMYMGGQSGWRFYGFHQTMLSTLCMFDEHIIGKIRELYEYGTPDVALEEIALESEPALSYIKNDKSHALFEKHFKTRLKEILDWVDDCEKRNKF